MRRAADLMAVAIIFGERGSSCEGRVERGTASERVAPVRDPRGGTTGQPGLLTIYNQPECIVPETLPLQIEPASSGSQGQAAQRGACSAVATGRPAVRGPRSTRKTSRHLSLPSAYFIAIRGVAGCLEGGTPVESIRRRWPFRSCTGRSRCLRRCLCRRRSPCICRSRRFRSLRHCRLLLHGHLWLWLRSRCLLPHRALCDSQDIAQDSLLISTRPRSFDVQSVFLDIRSELGQGGISIHQPVSCFAHQRCSAEGSSTKWPQHSCTLPRPAHAQAGSGPQMDCKEKGREKAECAHVPPVPRDSVRAIWADCRLLVRRFSPLGPSPRKAFVTEGKSALPENSPRAVYPEPCTPSRAREPRSRH